MGFSPWYLTSAPTAPVWTIQLVPDGGTFDVSALNPSFFSLLLHNLDTGIETTGQGVFSGLTAAVTFSTGVIIPASIQYQAAIADVNPGRYRVFVLVTLSNGILPVEIDEDWVVVPL
jgi:hypothetical protein